MASGGGSFDDESVHAAVCPFQHRCGQRIRRNGRQKFGRASGSRSRSMNSEGTNVIVVSSPSSAPVTCRAYVQVYGKPGDQALPEFSAERPLP